MSLQFFHSLPGWMNRLLFLILVVFLAGCGGPTQMSGTATPTQTILPAVTSTPEPTPTTAPTQSRVVSPVHSVSATPTPTSPPPIPTADFTPADILGIWTRSDPDRGDLFITILPEGAYLAAHGTVEGIVHAGKFTLDETLFTFLDGWNCSPLPQDTPGNYILRLGAGGRFLFFDLYDDTCPDRPAALQRVRWNRVVSTPTP